MTVVFAPVAMPAAGKLYLSRSGRPGKVHSMGFYPEEYRRSGFDRRSIETSVDNDRRSSTERRDVVRHGRVLIEKLKQTPLFRGYSPGQYAKIITIAARKEMSAGAVIYQAGNDSNDLYVLLEGMLEVSVGGRSVNLISPISFVGEMEFVSGEPRSASVTSKTDSMLFRFGRQELDRIFQGDGDLHIMFLESLLVDLSSKLLMMNKVFTTMKDQRKR